MRSEYRDRWKEEALNSLGDYRASYSGNVSLDVQALIRIATDKQHRVLYNSLSPRERNFLYELRDVRNRFAHENGFDERDVERALDTLELFIKAIGSPEAASIALLRRPVTRAAQITPLKSTTAIHQADTPLPFSPGKTGMERGVRLFRHLAEQANRGKALGISYGDFIAFLHAKNSFREVAGRNYLPSDSAAVIELARLITEANGGRIALTVGGRTIQSGMDTYIWASSSPHDRPEKAWQNPNYALPYSRVEWKAFFLDGTRHIIRPSDLSKLG